MSSQASHALKKKHSPLVPKQLDAVLLDEYLSSLLNAKVLFRYFPLAEADGVSNVLQESLIPILTLFFSRGKTPACQALGLQITSKERQHRQTFLLRLAVYAFLSFVLPQLYQYTKGKWMEQHQQQRHENSTPAKSLHPLAQERRQRVVKIFFRTMDAATPILRLGLLIRCWSGKQQSPSTSIGLWLAGLHYASTDGNSMLVPAPATTERSDRLYVSRDLHVLYGHRRWLHDEVMRLVPTTFSPLLHSSRETRDLVRSWIVR